MTRLITAGTSFAGQQPAEAHFGFDDADTIESISITRPDGTTTAAQSVTDIEDLYEIVQNPSDVNGDGLADAAGIACVEHNLRRFELRELLRRD